MTKNRNRLISVGIALLLFIAAAVLIIPTTTASAASFSGGDGSSGNPYRISTAADLAAIAQQVNNSGIAHYDGVYFKLYNDINLGGMEWAPIGKNDSTYWFNGNFDGDGHTISNLTITQKTDGGFLGLFGCSRGTIKNLFIKNVNINAAYGEKAAGAICAANYGTIEKCGVDSGTIVDKSSGIGGISGRNYGTISQCYNKADLTTENGKAAGISGMNYQGTIENCYNAGTITQTGTNENYLAGGICSDNNGGIVKYCLNFGKVISANGVGYGVSKDNGTVTECYYDEDVCGNLNGDGTAMTSAVLCSGYLPGSLDDSVWYEGSEDSKTDGRYKTAIYTYPSLSGVGTAATRKGGQTYDFSVGAIGKTYEDFTYIETPEDFKNIANNLSGNYVLKNDIDFKGEVIEPIGDSESVTGSGLSMPFSGNFSGDGHKILNVTVKRELGSHSGLFGANKGTIINLAVEADVSGTAYVGGICASNASGGRIADCSFSGTVNGTKSYVGGICGENKGVILRCAADGTVSGDSSVGGICGSNSGGDIENCLNSSDVTRKSSNGNIGGIVGESVDNSTVKFCISVGKTSGTDSGYIGGVCGYAYRATITNSYFDSEVSAGIKAIYDAFDDRDTETLKGLTTAGLSGELPTDFADTVWQAGRSEVTAIDGRAGTRTATYISLKNVGTPKVLESTPVYNFSLDNTVVWETYEPVASVEDFRKIEDDLSGNYVLARNIDFGGNNYRPIAYKSGTSFTGKFSGNGHTISNIRVNYSDDLVGLFGTNKGLIMNLAVSGEVTGEEYIGGICAKNEGTIYVCSFDGEVKQSATTLSKGKVGGICGINYATISNCFNSADVSGKNYIGGICGEMCGKDPVVVYCVSVGKVSGFTSSAIVGGICGFGNVSYSGSSELSHCLFDMDVSGSINLINGTSQITNRGDNYSYKTVILCSDEIGKIGSFDSDIWNAGKGVVVTPDAKDGKFGTKTCYYMSLKCFGEPEPITGDVYNFACAGGSDDWQPYTLISSEDVFRTYWQWDVKWSENFVLGDDITLAYSLAPDDLIPTSLSTGTFSGMFSGNGHTVTMTDDSTYGLFGTNKGTIINLAVKGNIDSSAGSSSGNYSGGICAVNDGTIYGCSFDGKIYGGANHTGAVCGLNNKTISNCFALANVKATNGQVGGIAALGKEGSELKSCYFVGTALSNSTVGLISLSSSENCYYNNEVCQFDEEQSGTGLTTLEMTSYSALAKMNFTDDIWEKRLNDTENGIAYYPSFKGSTYVPSVKYDKKLELNREGDKEPVYGDDIEFTTKALITFENDFYGDDITIEDPNGSFKVLVGDETEPLILLGKTFEHRADTVGDETFKLIYNGSGYFPENYFENFVVKIGKKALTAADFDVTLPADRTFDNTAKAASVTAKSSGVGEITVKYYDESGNLLTSAPVSAGTYTFKIDAAEGSNYKAVSGLTADSWKFTIGKAAAETLPDIGVSYRWSTDKDITVSVAGLPENMGQVTVVRTKKDGTISVGIIPGSCYSDGKFTFHLGPNTADDIGKTGSFTVKLVTDNYESVTFTVKINLTNKDNQEAPDPAAFDVVFTNDGSELTATIKTGLNGVEYSFDGKTWSNVNTMAVAHLKDVTAYLRYKETDELNAGEAVFKTVNSGHGKLVHHAAVQATCQNTGNVEYWECETCAKYYSNDAATTDVALADTTIEKTDHKWSVKYTYDKDGHWHKCEYCDAVTKTESHVSSGEATSAKAEYCTVCGYIITPRKGGSSGGHVSGGGGRDTTPTDTRPLINGERKTWTDIAADLGKQNGGSATISLNGETTVPAEVIKAIADRKIRVEFVYDSTKSWLVDGAEITAVSAVDLSLLPGSVDTSSLRGILGGKYRISADIPAEIRFAFRKQYAGEFANVYKLIDGKLVFQTCVKLAEDGTAVIPGMSAPGEYAVMVCRYSDRQGDFDNNGVLDIYDAVALLRYSTGLDSGESLQLIDLNGDGHVNCADASTVLRWLVGLSA